MKNNPPALQILVATEGYALVAAALESEVDKDASDYLQPNGAYLMYGTPNGHGRDFESGAVTKFVPASSNYRETESE